MTAVCGMATRTWKNDPGPRVCVSGSRVCVIDTA